MCINDQFYCAELINSLNSSFFGISPTVEFFYNQSRPTYFIFYSNYF